MTFLGGPLRHLSHMGAARMEVILANACHKIMDVFGEINCEKICSNLWFSWKGNIVMDVYVKKRTYN